MYVNRRNLQIDCVHLTLQTMMLQIEWLWKADFPSNPIYIDQRQRKAGFQWKRNHEQFAAFFLEGRVRRPINNAADRAVDDREKRHFSTKLLEFVIK